MQLFSALPELRRNLSFEAVVSNISAFSRETLLFYSGKRGRCTVAFWDGFPSLAAAPLHVENLKMTSSRPKSCNLRF